MKRKEKKTKLQQPQPPEIDRLSETCALGGMIKNSSYVNIKQAAAQGSDGENAGRVEFYLIIGHFGTEKRGSGANKEKC